MVTEDSLEDTEKCKKSQIEAAHTPAPRDYCQWSGVYTPFLLSMKIISEHLPLLKKGRNRLGRYNSCFHQ